MTTAVLAETAPVTIGVHRATLDDLIQVARHRRPVVIDEAVFEAMRPSQEWLQGVVDQMGPGKQTPPIYSINTGFGSLAGRQAFAEPSDAAELSRRLVLSNAAGVGRNVDEEVVRATMFIRIVSLTQGYSGVRPEIITTLAKMLNARRLPGDPGIRFARRLRRPDPAGPRGHRHVPLAHRRGRGTGLGRGPARRQGRQRHRRDARMPASSACRWAPRTASPCSTAPRSPAPRRRWPSTTPRTSWKPRRSPPR